MHWVRYDVHQMLEAVDKALVIFEQGLFPTWEGWAPALRGWALLLLGQQAEGYKLLLQDLERIRKAGAESGGTYFFCLLADASLRLGRISEGLVAAKEGLAWGSRTGEHLEDSELHRVRGELLWCKGEAAGALSEFHEAAEIAQRSGARCIECRAVLSLCHLLQEQGRSREALKSVEGMTRATASRPRLLRAPGRAGAARQAPGGARRGIGDRSAPVGAPVGGPSHPVRRFSVFHGTTLRCAPRSRCGTSGPRALFWRARVPPTGANMSPRDEQRTESGVSPARNVTPPPRTNNRSPTPEQVEWKGVHRTVMLLWLGDWARDARGRRVPGPSEAVWIGEFHHMRERLVHPCHALHRGAPPRVCLLRCRIRGSPADPWHR